MGPAAPCLVCDSFTHPAVSRVAVPDFMATWVLSSSSAARGAGKRGVIWRDAGLRKEKWAAAGGEQLSRGSPGRDNPDHPFQGAASP